MDMDAVVRALRDALGEALGEVRSVPVDDTWVAIEPDALVEAAELLLEHCGFWHLSTITGLDDGEGVVLHYHFWQQHGLTLVVCLPYDTLSVPTLTTLIPGALFYEREVAEMLGVTFSGHQGMEPLLLPEDWDAAPPLRHQSAQDDDRGADEGGE